MTRFLVIIFCKLDKNVKKKGLTTKQKPKQKKIQKPQNPSSFSLFTFVVLLPIDVGVVVVTNLPPLF